MDLLVITADVQEAGHLALMIVCFLDDGWSLFDWYVLNSQLSRNISIVVMKVGSIHLV